MKYPRNYREQFLVYEKAGFHVERVEPSRGSHLKVWFKEFSAPQFLTQNMGCAHAIKNNLARFRNLAAQQKEKK